jgi:hypothetical protein
MLCVGGGLMIYIGMMYSNSSSEFMNMSKFPPYVELGAL